MMTFNEAVQGLRTRNRRALPRVLLAALFAFQWGVQAAVPAFAQRRRAEPEANPQFQQDVQGKTPDTSGQPLEPAAMTAPAASEPSDLGRPAPFPSRTVSDVQVGATVSAPAPVPAPVQPMETRVTVRVKEAPLSAFLETISAQARVNFTMQEGLKGVHITAYLQNVTVREALQTLLEIKGLTYRQIGKSNTYIISERSKGAPAVRVTRIYTLNYISLTSVGGGAVLKGGTGAGATDGAAAMTGASSGQGSSGKAGRDDSGINIVNIIRSVLNEKTGQVAVDPRTNSIIITDVPEVFPQVEQIIAELDKKAPQVMIEAQIVEINSDRAQQLGLEWGGANGELAKFTGGARDTAFPLLWPRNYGTYQMFSPITGGLPNTQIVSGQGGGGGSGSSTGGNAAGGNGTASTVAGFTLRASVLDLTQLTVLLRAMITRSEARFLGKPKILTLNNKTATIEITQKQAIGVQSQSTSVGSSGASSATSAERENTGLKLDVTPQVNKEGYVTLLVEPSFTSIIASAVGTNIFDPVKRSASTMVRVKNGQTLVIGGLLSSRESKTVRKVPLLGYIPLIGWLFTSMSTSRDNTDLVIFITPTIIND